MLFAGAMSLAALVAVQDDASSAEASQPPAAEARSAEPAKGLWFGPIRMCRDRVVAAEVIAEDYSMLPALLISLTPDAQPLLGEETEKLIGQTMPVRLDGKIVSEPYVNEPIRGLQVQISGGGETPLEALRDAALRSC